MDSNRLDQETAANNNNNNRYAHLISYQQQSSVNTNNNNNTCQAARPAANATANANGRQQALAMTINKDGIATTVSHSHSQTPPTMRTKPPPLGHLEGSATGPNGVPKYAFYNSFSASDLSSQWQIIKSKILEKVEEPKYQRRLIMIIVCCALLLDNMLYMVIVPIIPDYLRRIGAWSTYTPDAKWVRRRNHTGGPMHWERVSGEIIYEGEDSAVGFLFASKAVVQLFINPFSGHIIDRIGYEIPMMIGLVVMFFSTMVFACGQTYSVLFLARSLQGVGSAFADTAGLAMIADRFTEENERQRALGVALAFISFGCLVAPPFGSILYQTAGKETPFIILSLICLIDGSLLLLVTPPGTFSQILPGYRPPPEQQQQQHQLATRETSQIIGRHQVATTSGASNGHQHRKPLTPPAELAEDFRENPVDAESGPGEPGNSSKKSMLKRQKSISRRQSLTVASAGEAPKGTPIYVLFRDPHIACCAGALVMANVSLAFLEPTISIWMQNTMKDLDEWQLGVIWLPAFFPHILGVYTTVKLADKYPKYQWLIAAIGLVLEGVSCLMVPFCTSFWSLIIPISVICFGVAQIDTAILPLLGYLVDTRYVSVYGSIYAIADISYSLSYAIGPIIAGGIVEAIGFTALNILIAVVTLGYVPALTMLRSVHDYEPFDADQTGLRKSKESPFGQFGRAPIGPDNNSSIQDDDDDDHEHQAPRALEYPSPGNNPSSQVSASNYGRPAWAAPDYSSSPGSPGALAEQSSDQLKSVLTRNKQMDPARKQHSVKIVEDQVQEQELQLQLQMGQGQASDLR